MPTLNSACSWISIQRVRSPALGLLFGLLVLLTRNLWLTAALHAWINTLLLGVAPRLETADGEVAFGSGAYVALALAVSVVAAAWSARGRSDL